MNLSSTASCTPTPDNVILVILGLLQTGVFTSDSRTLQDFFHANNNAYPTLLPAFVFIAGEFGPYSREIVMYFETLRGFNHISLDGDGLSYRITSDGKARAESLLPRFSPQQISQLKTLAKNFETTCGTINIAA